MPGGKTTITQSLPDLHSFLVRKRRPLEQWLIDNNITSQTALEAFLKAGTWSVSAELANQISGLLRPLAVPATIIPQPTTPEPVITPPVDVVVATEVIPVVLEEVVVTEPVPVIEEPPTPIVPVDEVASLEVEPVILTSNNVVVINDEGSGVSAIKADNFSRDRKKSR